MKYLAISSLLLFFAVTDLHAQTTSITTTDSLILNLSVTLDNKPIATVVNIENIATHKIIHCNSNKEGKASCTLLLDQHYAIKIPGSNDSYEYYIPDIAISPISQTFNFNRIR
jgi:hypothetical protein